MVTTLQKYHSLTRLANKLPNIDTDAPSNLSVRGEFAYLLPGAPKGTNFNGEATSYIDDFEGAQNGVDLKVTTSSWFLSSRPKELGRDLYRRSRRRRRNMEYKVVTIEPY